MSNFLSGIILYKNRKLIYDLDQDSHEFLIEKAGLNDKTDRPNFVRLELLPQDDDICNQDLDNWCLKVDQDLHPDWFDPKVAETMMKDALQKVWAERFIIGGEHQEIKDRKVRLVKNAKIIQLINSQVGEMWGSSLIIVYSKWVKVRDMQDDAIFFAYYKDNPEIVTPNSMIKVKKP